MKKSCYEGDLKSFEVARERERKKLNCLRSKLRRCQIVKTYVHLPPTHISLKIEVSLSSPPPSLTHSQRLIPFHLLLCERDFMHKVIMIKAEKFH